MKLIISVSGAVLVWILLYRVFFDDFENFRETAKENTFWFAVAMIFDTTLGGVRFLIYAAIGILSGVLIYRFI